MKIIHQQLTSIRRIISLVLRHFGFLEPNTILKVRLSQWWRSTGLIMTSIIALAVAVSFSMDDSVFATAPTLTVTIPENIVSISVAPASADGTFVESDDLDFSVTTDNYSGYILTIKAASATNLVSGTDVLATLPSGSSLTAEAFEGGANYINKWGYKPSKLNSVANSTYRPSPSTTTGDVIENRNTAGTNIPYTISIGAKVDLTQPIGEYSNTFVITAVANLTSYTITYDANDGNSGNDTTNMPATNPQTGNADPSSITSVTLASAPTRSGFDFMGWCTVQVADDAACTGTEYAAADTYDINFQGTNTFTLYARWAARQSLYDTVAAMSKGMQTNDANASTGIQAAIVAPTEAAPISSNSGVYEYNATVFGASSDDTDSCTRADNCPIYYYRGILDSYGHTGSYGSDGLADAYPNYVILQSGSSKATTDTCWRIVRTTGSGGVKMIYNGKWTGSTCANATTNAQVIASAFNNSSASNGYTSLAYQNIHAVGYTYNDDVNGVTTASADTTIAKVLGSNDDYNVNDSDSIIKQYIEKTWFTNISAYQSILETSAGYCNDRSMYPNGSYGLANKLAETTQIVPYGTSGMTIYYFGAYTRNNNAAQAPTLNCPRGTVDIYSVSGASTGNGQLAKPASLLTADELSFAGSGRSTASQGSSYHANSYLRSGSNFWLLSPIYRDSSGGALEFYLVSSGYLLGNSVSRAFGVRPAISLTSGTTASSGSGTATDPWVVNPPPKQYMQDLDKATCQTLTASGPITVYDKRDESDYTVRYINDACWMTQNLRITKSTGLADWTISSTDSNFSTNSTWNIHVSDLTAGNSYTEARSHLADASTVADAANNGYTITTEGQGAWYNYCAASAGTVCSQTQLNATEDICPAGWHLPSYNTTPGAFSGMTGTVTLPDGTNAASLFSPVYGGIYLGGTLNRSGTGGRWWSSTAYSTNFQYYLSYYDGSLSTVRSNKYGGYYVRCVRTS